MSISKASVFLTLASVGMCLLLACSDPSLQGQPNGTPSRIVVATTWPLTTLAQALLGPDTPVECLLEPGEDPAQWTPDAGTQAQLMQAKAVLINGAHLETWLMSVNLAPTRLINVSVAFTASWIEYQGELQHSHGNRGSHDHVGVDPHVWMDPLLALEQARTLQIQAVQRGWISQELASQRGSALEVRLREIDSLWARVAQALDGRSLLANHDAYSYPARRYGLNIYVIDADPQKALDAELSTALKAAVEEHKPRCMLFEAVPQGSLAAFLQKQLGLDAVLLSPAESPGELDAIESMHRDLSALLRLLEVPPGE
ncbi:MAG: zinc transport system substrate-binding protein [Planctomycetota bacterium]|jgi:zinc transport system substrate-binding protein